MLNKKTIPIIACLCALLAGMLFIYKNKHEIKWEILHIASRIKHKITGVPELKRFDAQAPVPGQNGVAVFIASSLDRIFKDGKTLLKPSFDTHASMSLAENEYASFQVVVQSQSSQPINNVYLKISILINQKTGVPINNASISWRVVGYVQTLEPYYPTKYVGLWPDPLLPAHKTNINPHETQPFWVTVHTSEDTDAGDYQGQIAVNDDQGVIQIIPFSVHVFNFALPRTNHLKTAFDFYGQLTKIRYPQAMDETDAGYGARMDELNDKFISTMLQYRMNPILNVDPTSQDDLSKVDRYLALGLTNFSIGKRGGTFNNNWPKSDADIQNLFSLYRTYGEDLKLNDMLQYTYIYTWDEGDMGNPQVSKIASMIHQAYPDLKNMVCYHGIWDTAQGSDWIKDIDIWTFQIDDFNEANMRKLQQMGKEMWMYISGPAGTDTPNLAMDFDSIDYRIIPWLCWKYDIKGFLYWSVNYWPSVDPFENARNAQWAQNGNGLLIYPGKDGPIASLRMEIFRDGMEDYEYIQILFEDLKTLKIKHLDQIHHQFFQDSVKLLTMDDSIAASMSKFTHDGDALMARRDAIAKKIEEYNSFHL